MNGSYRIRNRGVCGFLVAALAIAWVPTAQATLYEGTLYYTHYTGGGPNVLNIDFSYDDGPQTLTYGPQTGLSTVFGADGILFAPNGDLIVTSNATSSVYRINSTTGALKQTVSTGTPGYADYHMALDPSGTKLYSSNRYNRVTGPLDTFAIHPDGSLSSATTSAIVGGDSNVTQLAFDASVADGGSGRVFYTNGTPNANGSVGLFTFGSPNVTTQLFAASSIVAAHGIIYDPFTGRMTMFGGGQVATLDPTAATNGDIVASLLQYNVPGVGDFDQGAVDGYGHAFIAGAGAMTFIDYSTSGDITNPDKVIVTGGFGAIDDIAPLVGLGSQNFVPGPATLGLLPLGLAGLFAGRRRRRRI